MKLAGKNRNNLELPPVQPELLLNMAEHKEQFAVLNTVSKKSGVIFQQFRMKEDCEVGFLPEGCVNILFECEGNSDNAIVIGIHTRRKTLNLKKDCLYFGIKMYSTFGLKHIFLGEFTDREVRLDDFIPNSYLADRLIPHETFEERILIFQDSYRKWINENYFPGLVEECALLLCDSGGNMSIGNLEAYTCYSKRYIQQQFVEHYGISPKVFGMLKRYQSALALLMEREQSIAHIAAESGYYDQSHFIKEFKRFTGFTPEQYRKEILLISAGTRSCLP